MMCENGTETIKEPLRVLVCGSRQYIDFPKIFRILDAIQEKLTEPMILIEGCAHGADSWAGVWADDHLPEENHLKFPAHWKKFGRAAGPRRNQQMLDEGKPDLVIAFGKRKGSGTEDMVKRSIKAGISVLEFDGCDT